MPNLTHLLTLKLVFGEPVREIDATLEMDCLLAEWLFRPICPETFWEYLSELQIFDEVHPREHIKRLQVLVWKH